jgi:hypothetical protein
MKLWSQYTKYYLLALAAAICLLAFVGCDANETSKTEQALTERNQKTLLRTQPPVSLNWSLERQQINKRTSLWNDPNKVSYIYLVSFGKVMSFLTIKGKVSSVNSQITNPSQVRWRSSGIVTLPSPAEDGSYGENGDAIFFFTTDGTYVEWAGDYMLADKPLKLSTPPVIVRQTK